MIDIFADIKPNPKLYIADVTLKFNYRPRKNSKTIEQYKVNLYQVPIVLNDGRFPTKETENSFMKRIFMIAVGLLFYAAIFQYLIYRWFQIQNFESEYVHFIYTKVQICFKKI